MFWVSYFQILGLQIPGFPDLWISGFPNSWIFRFPDFQKGGWVGWAEGRTDGRRAIPDQTRYEDGASS